MTWARFCPLVLAVLVFVMVASPPSAYAKNQSSPRLLLLYHEGYENEQIFMRAVYNLMTTFGVEITPVNVEHQEPWDEGLREVVAEAKYMVYLEDRQGTLQLPDHWAQAIRNSTAAVYFMGADPGAVLTGLPFSAANLMPSATKLVIRGETYPLDVALDVRDIQLPSSRKSTTLHAKSEIRNGNLWPRTTEYSPVQVWSEVSNGDRTTPFVVSTRSGAGRVVFACGRYAAYGELSYAIADSLYEFFGVEDPSLREAYIRIEDVHPMRDPEEIRRITAFLSGEHIPFLIGVIPIYQNGSEQVTLTDRPELVHALQEAQNKGTPV